MTSDSPGLRRILLAPFGLYTRHVLASHLRHIFVIALALLTVALSIDLPPQITKVLAAAPASAWDNAARLGWFALLRSADLLPRFIPLVTFLGVLWTEIMLTVSRARILVWNTGRSTVQCLVPAAILAVTLGAAQFACDAYLRPAAMGAQIREKLGTLGIEYDRGLSREVRWIALGSDLLHTRLAYGPPVVLHDVTLYRLNENGRLREVDNAQTAIPTATRGYWLLQHGSYWVIPPERASGPASVAVFTRGTRATAISFQTHRVPLATAPLWVSLWGIAPEYLSHGTLLTLKRDAFASSPPVIFIARIQFNYANALMPGAMALLAETLCLLLFAYGAPVQLQLAALPAGYAGHLAMKTFLLLGEHDYMNPVIATALAPLLLLAVSAGLLAAAEWRRRTGKSLRWSDLRKLLRKPAAA